MRLDEFYYWSQEDGPAPVPPVTRADVCSVKNSFQGLLVRGRRWWDPYFLAADKAERLDAYAAKRAAGDTHVLLTLEMTGLASLPQVYDLAYEAVTEGGMTCIALFCRGDGNGRPDEPNYDPGALGWYWLMENFQAIVDYWRTGNGKRDLTDRTLFVPGFDGVVPGWQPFTRVNQFAQMARAVLGPSGHLGIELSAGYWCWSGETDDWNTPDGEKFDVVLAEFAISGGSPDTPVPDDFCSLPNDVRAPFDQDWQISKRLLGPFWKRPPEMPDCDDPGMFHGGPMTVTTPRGPQFVIPFEYDTYRWIRLNQLTTEDVRRRGRYYDSLGYAASCRCYPQG